MTDIARTAAIALVLAGGGLTACTTNGSIPEPTSTSPVVPTSNAAAEGTTGTAASAPPSGAGSLPAPSAPPGATADAVGEARVRILIGDQTLHATLHDNPAAASLLAQLPLTLQFSPYSGQEATAKLPSPLTMTGMPDGDAPEAGDLGYYAPDGVLTLHYADIGYWQGSARLGRIDGDLSSMKDRPGPFAVTIEPARS